MSREVVTGLNVLKNGSDPALKNDDELPEWLWKLAGQRKTLAELQRQDEATLSLEDLKYKQRLENRKKIRANNALKSK
jgi:anti-sigma factor ChrR (cupin superfamily)